MELQAKDPNEYLPADVAREFEVVNWPAGVSIAAFPKFSNITPQGNVNLKTMTIAKANALVQAGFPRLKRKEVKAAKAVEAPAGDKAGK